MKTTLNKMKMIAITLVCVIFGVLFFINGSGEVKAETSVTLNTTDTETEYAYAVFSTAEELNHVQAVMGESAPEVSGAEQHLFAGWYSNKACTDTVKKYDASITTYYAKYIPEEVLDVKAQVSTIAGKNDENEETRNIRFVSSVDNLSYNKVGFKLECNEQTLYNNSKTVFQRIDSATEGDEYSYSPKVVDADSEYFITAVYPDVADFDIGFYVRAYVKTLDGVVVYGPSRYVRVSDGLTGSESLINMPVKDTDGVITEDTVNVTYSGGTVSASVLQPESKDDDDSYAHILIDLNDVKKDTLKSVTTFSVSGIEVKYRNLFTTHVNTASETTPLYDTSWYEAYKDDTSVDSYVVATSADLYGLAQIVNGTAKDSSGATMQSNFAGKKVYVVSDIELNKGYANAENLEDLKWDTAKDANGEQFEEGVVGTSYQWTRIGTSATNAFSGTFDGQTHSFSGVYYNDSTTNNWHGLFGFAVKATTIKNFSLTNSYFKVTANCMGSIVGRAQGGTYESIYSDAIVNGANVNIGGLIGQHQRDQSTLIMTNCWFDGVVANSNNYTGGFVGNELSGATFTNCLNTGTVQGAKYVGGFVGDVDDENVDFTHCLNSGTITVTNEDKTNVGAIAGSITDSDSKKDYGTVTFSNTFITDEALQAVYGQDSTDDVTFVTVANVAGIKALTADTKALFSYIIDETTQANESYWAIVSGGTPVLASFKEFAKVDGENAGAMAVDTSWYNTVDTEFVLSDAADLYGLALLSKIDNFEKKTIKLNKDITINEGEADNWDTEAPSHNWLGIGTDSLRFAGTFDGQMHTIGGVYLSATESNVGLFNYTNSLANIKNLKLIDSYFETTKGAIGSVVGYGYGTFDTIYSDAVVKGGTFWIGGMIGQTHSASTMTMNNCWFDGEVAQSGTGNAEQKACVGGLVGLAHNTGNITNCLNTGNVSAAYTASEDPCVGGLVGRVSEDKTLTIKNSFDAGTILVADTVTTGYGPIVGKVETSEQTTITDSFAYSKNYVADASTVYTGVTNVSENDILGTDALKKMTLLFTNQVSDTEYASCWAIVVGGAPVLESFVEMIETEFLAIDTSWYNGDGNYIISDASDLYGFALMSYRTNFPSETIAINEKVDEIRINEGKPYGENGIAGDEDDWTPKYEWISITPATNLRFAGTFDGNMKTISGIYMNSTKDYSGFFGLTMPSAVVKNLSLTDSYFESANIDLGSVIGNARGTIQNVYSNAIVVSGNKDVGGLVGRVSGSTEFIMNNCWFNGTVTNNGNSTSRRYTGGLIGSIGYTTTITNSLNSGKIAAPNYTVGESSTNTSSIRPHIGGVVGSVDSEKTLNVTNCFNSGVVTYNEAATVGYGAIVGNASASGLATLTNTYATTSSCDVLATGNVSVNGDEAKSTAEAIAQWLIADSNCKGTNALSYMMNLFTYETADGKYENYWSVVPGKTPILTSFASEVEDEFLAIDTSWYDGSGSYALSDVSDFYGFALLSYKKNFANETITLEEDITVNEGTPYGADGIAGTDDDWNPKYEWVKIGSYDSSNDIYRFNGIFDGQGHTISGIYLQTGQLYSALFGLLDSDGVVKNFSLLNSYVNSSGRSVASVVGHARGTIDTIYSNAIVIGSSSNVGGILGQVDSGGMKSVSNCWFDGQVTNNSNSQSTGGLIGSAGGSITITNCLNTGEVSAPNYTNVEDETSVKPLIGGLIGYAVCTSKISIQNCLNTGNVSFNSVATAGFGSIIGRIGTRSADNTEDQNIVVENTYATSQSCWETVSTSDTWPNITVTVVDNNTIGGESAKDETTGTPGLFDETLTTSWMASEKHPVLKAFEKYASTEKSITALHQWLTSSESLSAKLQNPVTLPNPDQDMTTFFRQGGYTDGQYFYQAYITYKDPGTDEVAAGTGNKVKVLKYDLMSEEYVWSDEMELNHANDITFNSKLGCLVVCHASPNANKVSYINITEGGLVLGEAVELGFNIYNIDYNAAKDVYVAEGDSRNFYVLNSDFKKISKAFTPADVSKQHTGQGVSCDDDYIYFVLSASDVVNTEVIAVYDWSGALVSTITLTIDSNSNIIESENISVVGDKIYIMVAEVVGTAANPTDKPANVYTIDLSVTE